ncbi:ABC transporter permease subunit [Mycoplasmopsis fermentans]|uniref:ABC transporter permease subunit n=1 Tax=Mycoplasmopsis fermentans TaxID=2115 RepID=UPI000F03C2F1|nr:ABC transporter permease subunit [Mycoplasmopsis fermentans]RMX34980.1 binding--dependent transport system inner membrane component family protein [Mycoplasmopsis fermentans MF-I1]RMX35085.1 binding--dependent transport system inner membrane component family protein [Mycoplasmopsis fermentans MF-I2]
MAFNHEHHHSHEKAGQSHIEFEKSLFTLTHHKHFQVNISNNKSEFKQYLIRFFSKKINIALVSIIGIFLLFLTLSAIFSPYSPKTSVIDSQLAYNLPNYLNASITKKFAQSDPLYQFILQTQKDYPNLKIVINETPDFDLVNLTYNPYQLLYALKGTNYIFLYGTNSQGIDRFSFFIHSFGISILVTFVAALIQLFLGTFLGSIVAYYSNKSSAKFSYYLISTINIVPFLIVVFLIFKISSYNHLNAILILGFIGSLSFFYSSYSIGLEIKNSEFILAYKANGLSNRRIIYKIIFIHCLWRNIALVSDSLSLNMLALASLAFFNIYKIDQSLNIGNVFKDIVDNLKNVEYTIFVSILASFYVILVKFLGINFFIASVPKLEK